MSRKTSTDYHVPLSDALRAKQDEADYQLLFKSSTSIMSKLWRKNQESPSIHLGNIQQNLTDLVRTDVSASTLDHAAFLAEP